MFTGQADCIKVFYKPNIIILLDVMASHFDGWGYLKKIRQHPLASKIPLVVCSMIPLDVLARLSGASSIIHKPVTAEAILTTLEHWVAYENNRFR